MLSEDAAVMLLSWKNWLQSSQEIVSKYFGEGRK
jgi:hypothetical protein